LLLARHDQETAWGAAATVTEGGATRYEEQQVREYPERDKQRQRGEGRREEVENSVNAIPLGVDVHRRILAKQVRERTSCGPPVVLVIVKDEWHSYDRPARSQEHTVQLRREQLRIREVFEHLGRERTLKGAVAERESASVRDHVRHAGSTLDVHSHIAVCRREEMSVGIVPSSHDEYLSCLAQLQPTEGLPY
jgi:hypothetical protein